MKRCGCSSSERRLSYRASNLRERRTGQLAQIHHGYAGDAQLFFRYVCRFWTEIKTSLGPDFSQRFGFDNSSDDEFFQNVLAVAHDYPDTQADLESLLAQRPELARTVAAVSYLRRVRNASDDTWSATTKLLERADGYSDPAIEQAWTALHTLTEQFRTDPRTNQWLDTQLTRTEDAEIVTADGTYLPLPRDTVSSPQPPGCDRTITWSPGCCPSQPAHPQANRGTVSPSGPN